jgi:hypothetical protein
MRQTVVRAARPQRTARGRFLEFGLMYALCHLLRPAHRPVAVLLVALALVVALLARSMGTPRATAAEKLTMEVCSSSGVSRWTLTKGRDTTTTKTAVRARGLVCRHPCP